MTLLSPDFLRPYYERGDVFPNLLARVIYLSKYRHPEDERGWTDTIRRVVEGNCALDKNVTRYEAEALFDAFWNMNALPAGRGLWVGGRHNVPVEARFSCWGTTLDDYNEWCWVMNMLMLGGGVGVNLIPGFKLPAVSMRGSRLVILCRPEHPDYQEVHASPSSSWLDVQTDSDDYVVEDSRQGWVEALYRVLRGGFQGTDVVIDVSQVRSRGSILKTFGGIASGPAPLVELLRSVNMILQQARGRCLTSVESLDITNYIGKCVVSGNVRRSALIQLGGVEDHAFHTAKQDFQAVRDRRYTSNNSVAFEEEEDLIRADWNMFAEHITVLGEPGFVNLVEVRKSDPGAVSINPCAEIPLHRREACNLSEFYPARTKKSDQHRVLTLLTRYTLRNRLEELSDQESYRKQKENMRLGVGLSGICDEEQAAGFFSSSRQVVKGTAYKYADELRVNRPIATTTVKPSGTISLLCGSSPGMHSPYAPHYIRRVRIGKEEPIAHALMEAGVPFEENVYNQAQWCFEFVAKSGAKTTVQNETVVDQFERQLKLQREWADNSVSATITFSQDERSQLPHLLKEYVTKLKSTSLMAKASEVNESGEKYPQLPYEAITAAEFMRRYESINHTHPLTSLLSDTENGVEMDGCQNGICPIR